MSQVLIIHMTAELNEGKTVRNVIEELAKLKLNTAFVTSSFVTEQSEQNPPHPALPPTKPTKKVAKKK